MCFATDVQKGVNDILVFEKRSEFNNAVPVWSKWYVFLNLVFILHVYDTLKTIKYVKLEPGKRGKINNQSNLYVYHVMIAMMILYSFQNIKLVLKPLEQGHLPVSFFLYLCLPFLVDNAIITSMKPPSLSNFKTYVKGLL